MTELGQILTNNIETLLHRQSMTQRELSAKSGIPTATISNYMTGRNYPRPAKMEQIAKALGVSAAFLTTKHDTIGAKNDIFDANVAQNDTQKRHILPKDGVNVDDDVKKLLGKPVTFWEVMREVDKMTIEQQRQLLGFAKVINKNQ